MKTLLFALACVAAIALPSNAQDSLKIGIIDMDRLFGSYYRTSEVRDELESRDRAIEAEMVNSRAQLTRLHERRQELVNEIESVELSPQRRDAARRELNSVQAEFNTLERQMREHMQRENNLMRETAQRSMRSIFEALTETIEQVSSREGYQLVFDSSGRSQNNVPVLLYSGDLVDFTDLVIDEVNQDAPEDFEVPDLDGSSGVEDAAAEG